MAALLYATPALATGTDTPPDTSPPTTGQPPGTDGPPTGAPGDDGSLGQSQQQTQTQSTANANNAQQQVDARQYYRRGVATAYAPSVVNMAPCSMGAGLGVQGASFGLSLGGSKTNKACERRANAMTLMNLGEREAAVLYLAAGDPAINDALTLAREREAAFVPVGMAPAPRAVVIPPPARAPAPAAGTSWDGERG